MKYIVNIIPDIEEILVTEIRKHFYNDVRFKNLYPQFQNIRISGVHPFAYLIESQVNDKAVPNDLFPSITIVDENDSKDQDGNMLAPEKSAIEITSAEVADMEDSSNAYKYVLSEDDLRQLKTLTADSGIVYAVGYSQRRNSSVAMEVWSKNPKVKNRVYDILRNFLIGSGRATLTRTYDMYLKEPTLSGNKSGNYNFDFGYTVYGGMLRFELAYVTCQYVVDSDTEGIGSITHGYEEVKNDES